MTVHLQAIYQKGVLRPLVPLSLAENEMVIVSISNEEPADDAIPGPNNEGEDMSLEDLRKVLSVIPGLMAQDVIADREERFE